jgi:hypothetical protein
LDVPVQPSHTQKKLELKYFSLCTASQHRVLAPNCCSSASSLCQWFR